MNERHTFTDVVIELLEDYEVHSDYLELIAECTDTPPAILAKLSENDNFDVRAYVALNPSTPLEVLKKLVNDRDFGIRVIMAKNPHTPLEILKLLAGDDNLMVCLCVMENPSSTKDVIDNISKDKRKMLSDPQYTEDIEKNDPEIYILATDEGIYVGDEDEFREHFSDRDPFEEQLGLMILISERIEASYLGGEILGYTMNEFNSFMNTGVIAVNHIGDVFVFETVKAAIEKLGYDPTNDESLNSKFFDSFFCDSHMRDEIIYEVRISEALLDLEDKRGTDFDPYDIIFEGMNIERGSYNTGW